MHLYCITRGVKNDVDQFITELQGKYLTFKHRDKPEEPLKDKLFQFGVRPVQLWEFAFPEEHKDLILNSLFRADMNGEKAHEGQHSWYKKFIWMIRKILHCEPIPKYDTSKAIYIRRDNVELVGIGIKSDYWVTPDGKHHDTKQPDSFEGI